MTRPFATELTGLRFGLLDMAGRVEEMLHLTHQALVERSNHKAEQVARLDRAVDEAELKLDQACIDLLALRAPFASDLRLIASTLKLVPELERVGDHCCNIARRALLLNLQPPALAGDGVERLGLATQAMLHRAGGRLRERRRGPGPDGDRRRRRGQHHLPADLQRSAPGHAGRSAVH